MNMASIKRIMDNLNHVSTFFSVLISPANSLQMQNYNIISPTTIVAKFAFLIYAILKSNECNLNVSKIDYVTNVIRKYIITCGSFEDNNKLNAYVLAKMH